MESLGLSVVPSPVLPFTTISDELFNRPIVSKLQISSSSLYNMVLLSCQGSLIAFQTDQKISRLWFMFSCWFCCLVQMCTCSVLNIDEFKLKLQYATIELESVKVEANKQMKRHKDEVKYLVNLLKLAYQERDEAKNQLEKLLNKFMPTSSAELQPMLPHSQHESPLIIPAKANSSITESNSLSDTYNHHSHGSSPGDSFFDAVTSPEFSSMNNMSDSNNMGFLNQPFVQDYNRCVSTGLVSSAVTKTDPEMAVIDSFVKGKTLPEKGKLLQSVMEAGPLLQTLLVAGPLPRWKNPPPLQPFKIPPVSIKGCEATNLSEKASANPSVSVQKQPNTISQFDMSRISPQICSVSVLNFGSFGSTSGLSSSWPLSAGAGAATQMPVGKRQRFH